MEGGVLMFITGPLSTIGYLDRNRIQIFQSGNASIFSLDLPETAVRDLTVVNRGILQTLLASFLRDHAIRPSPLVLVFSEASYFSQALKGEEREKELQFQQFIDTIPFDTVYSKRYIVDEKELGIVVPKNFSETVQRIGEGEGFRVVAVVPVFALGPMQAGKRWLDVDMGKYAIKEVDALVRQSMLHTDDASHVSPAINNNFVKDFVRKNQGLTVLVAFFIMLTIILILVLLRLR